MKPRLKCAPVTRTAFVLSLTAPILLLGAARPMLAQEAQDTVLANGVG
jgi:hypothetical protein